MLRDELSELATKKSEADPVKREKLKKFTVRASDGRLRKGWTTTDGLKLAIREALDNAKATKQRPGWVKGNQHTSTEVLEKLVAAQEEIERLKLLLANVTPKILAPDNLAGLETGVTLTIKYDEWSSGGRVLLHSKRDIETSFSEVFELLAPHLIQAQPNSNVDGIISSTIWERHSGTKSTPQNLQLRDEIFQTLKIQFLALNLVTVKTTRTVSGGVDLFWQLTDLGEQEMINQKALTSV